MILHQLLDRVYRPRVWKYISAKTRPSGHVSGAMSKEPPKVNMPRSRGC